MKKIVYLLCVAFVVGSAPADASELFNVKAFGAIGDGVTKDTVAVQKAIDTCSESGGGVVRIPAGRYVIGSIKNIRISDVVAKVVIEDREKAARAHYKNVKVDTTPGFTDKEKAKAGPIMITGILGHYVENVVLENTVSPQDAREDIVLEDVTGFETVGKGKYRTRPMSPYRMTGFWCGNRSGREYPGEFQNQRPGFF